MRRHSRSHEGEAMAHTYAKITGKDQKDFKGGSTRSGREGWIEVSVETSSDFTVNPDTGKPTGALNRGSFIITGEEHTHSPNVVQAHLKVENIVKVVIETCARGEDGKGEIVVSRFTLEDGYIHAYKRFPMNVGADQRADRRHGEAFHVSCRKLTYEHVQAKNSVTVDWNAPNG
jgi:type VI secretion system Hcp family effector